MSDLTDFLLARIAEDEAVSKAAVGTGAFARQTGRWVVGHPRDHHGTTTIVFAVTETGARTQAADLTLAWESAERARHIALHDPARVLAECEAKRRIVETADEATALDMQVDSGFRVGSRNEADEPYVGDLILRALALPYADPLDFREEWRP